MFLTIYLICAAVVAVQLFVDFYKGQQAGYHFTWQSVPICLGLVFIPVVNTVWMLLMFYEMWKGLGRP
jgi:hypothetical protein